MHFFQDQRPANVSQACHSIQIVKIMTQGFERHPQNYLWQLQKSMHKDMAAQEALQKSFKIHMESFSHFFHLQPFQNVPRYGLEIWGA